MGCIQLPYEFLEEKKYPSHLRVAHNRYAKKEQVWLDSKGKNPKVYAYVINNPLKYTDPSGEKWTKWLNPFQPFIAAMDYINHVTTTQRRAAVNAGVGDFGVSISGNGVNQYSIGIGIGTVETNTVYNSDYGKSIPGINFGLVDADRGNFNMHQFTPGPSLHDRGGHLLASTDGYIGQQNSGGGITPVNLGNPNAGEHLIHNLSDVYSNGRVPLSSIVDKSSSFPTNLWEETFGTDMYNRQIGYVNVAGSNVRLSIYPRWGNNDAGILRSFKTVNIPGNYGFSAKNINNGAIIHFNFYKNKSLRDNVYNYIRNRDSNVNFIFPKP